MRRYLTMTRAVKGGEHGSALVELALAMPIMLALAGAIVDGGWALHQATLLGAAAEAAQRAAALRDTGAANCAGAPPASYGDLSKAAAEAAAPTLDASRLTVGVSYAEPACTGRMRTLVVSLSYTLRAFTPWFAGLLNGRSITAQAGSAVEEVPPPWWSSAAQIQTDQAQIQAQQAQIASLAAAYQAMQSAASYYYGLWQQVLKQLAADGVRQQ